MIKKEKKKFYIQRKSHQFSSSSGSLSSSSSSSIFISIFIHPHFHPPPFNIFTEASTLFNNSQCYQFLIHKIIKPSSLPVQSALTLIILIIQKNSPTFESPNYFPTLSNPNNNNDKIIIISP